MVTPSIEANCDCPRRVLKRRINGKMQTATLKYSDGSWPEKLLYYPTAWLGKALCQLGCISVRNFSIIMRCLCVRAS
ncbi:hypothetical protein BT93_L1420 [Corymbia citriodora subsp. variegata]|uniref:Uncharacterized protein n=1 Tax=Corymbia citriodora subsp. variegata TaxID=360336 RepID=A0A8T0CNZ1_CORYI|nr:hypothetical protein BT93_L1420 [Corymbia citriodora subsp. variegata]